MRSKPLGEEKCNRESSVGCSQEKKAGNYYQRNVVYKTRCLECKGEGKVSEYLGKTGRD